MANGLDEMMDPVLEEGREINVIAKQIPVKVGVGSKIFEVMLWVLGIIPGLIFLIMKIKAATYLRQLEQKLQHDASQVDNYLVNRVNILSNLAKLVDKAVDCRMVIVTGYNNGFYGNIPFPQVVNDPHGIHIIRDSKIGPHFFTFDIACVDTDDHINFVFQTLQQT